MPPSAAPVADLAAVALDALDDDVLIEAGGDRVLAQAARRLSAEARAIDTVGRIGGGSSRGCCPTPPAESLAAAHSLRRAIRSAPGHRRGRPS